MFAVQARISGFGKPLRWTASLASEVLYMCRGFLNTRGLDIPIGTGETEFLFYVGSTIVATSNDLIQWEVISPEQFEAIINEL